MATQLPALRRARGLSQRALARLVGCSHSTIGDIESGRLLLSYDSGMANRIARVLRVQPFELLVPTQSAYGAHRSTARLRIVTDRTKGER